MKKPIQINITDKRLYAQIAFLVDSIRFLQEIENVREEFSIDPKMQADDYSEKATDKELSLKRTDLLNRVTHIRQKYQFPPYFDDAIAQAILFHRINSVKATQAVIHTSSKIPDTNRLASHDIEVSIIVTPVSTKKEVDEAFKDAQNLMKDYEKLHPLLKKDASENIERDRNWFWRNAQGESPHDIAIQENKGKDYYTDIKRKMKNRSYLSDDVRSKYDRQLAFIDDYTETVRKAIKRYKKNLSAI